ncbi:phage portal protein [Mammaliicoccus sciuri]|uniref:phage portal protein n=1 Tax=Mammaliicoccus sciuri TaxID=1296 RepID=UPI002DBA4838|nr:phage portal protein [Mammaliicoccus sciuri]MEB6263616.1 phage portal protein [Mammaliicoccus sciuri]
MSIVNFKGFKRNNEVPIDKDVLRLILDENNGGNVSWSGLNALRNSDVFTAIKIISSDIASTNILVKGNDVLEQDSDILKLFNKRPNPYMNGFQFKFIISANMLLNGKSFVEIIRDDDGNPIELYHLANGSVTMFQEDEYIYYRYIDPDRGDVKIESEDMLHFRLFTLDGFKGFSPLYSLVNEIGISMGSKNFLDNFFKNGATSTGIFKYKEGAYNEDELTALRNQFENSQLKNNSGFIMLDDTTEFERLQIPTEVLNFLNSYKFSTQQVAKAFGLPMSKLGIETVNTSLAQSNIEYYQSTLYPYFAMMSGELENKLFSHVPYEISLGYDVDRLIDSDPEIKLQRVTELHNKKIITTDEARAEFGYNPIENGSEPLADLNTIFLKDLEKYQGSKVVKEADKALKGGDEYDEQ